MDLFHTVHFAAFAKLIFLPVQFPFTQCLLVFYLFQHYRYTAMYLNKGEYQPKIGLIFNSWQEKQKPIQNPVNSQRILVID